MIKEQEMLEIELKENFEKDIDIIRNHITSLRLIGVGLSNTLNEKDEEIERLNNIINEFDKFLFGELQIYGGGGIVQEYYDKLQELKGDGSNEL